LLYPFDELQNIQHPVAIIIKKHKFCKMLSFKVATVFFFFWLFTFEPSSKFQIWKRKIKIKARER
jgi:hypothetical protein